MPMNGQAEAGKRKPPAALFSDQQACSGPARLKWHGKAGYQSRVWRISMWPPAQAKGSAACRSLADQRVRRSVPANLP